MLRDATQRTFFALLPPGLIRDFTKSEGHLTLANGSEILFRSLDAPDRARGVNLAWFWLDEAPLCGYYAWQVLKGRLRQKGYPTAGWATGTPTGRDGYARDFELSPRRAHTLFRASTYSNAHHLPPGYVEELGYRGAFARQEVLGLFVAFEGLVYAFDASPQGHLREAPGEFTTEDTENTEKVEAKEGMRGDFTTEDTEDTEDTEKEETEEKARGQGLPVGLQPTSSPYHPLALGHPPHSPLHRGGEGLGEGFHVVGGVDWGYTNPAAALVFALDGDGRAWQLDEFYQRRAALEETLLPALLDLTRRYGVREWYCGPDEPEHIDALAAALAHARLPARALRADNAVRPGIQTITGLLARRPDGTRGLYVSPRCRHTIAEYASYQYASADAGGDRDVSEAPLKQNDHAMDATRYALHSALGRARATNAYLARMRRPQGTHPRPGRGG